MRETLTIFFVTSTSCRNFSQPRSLWLHAVGLFGRSKGRAYGSPRSVLAGARVYLKAWRWWLTTSSGILYQKWKRMRMKFQVSLYSLLTGRALFLPTVQMVSSHSMVSTSSHTSATKSATLSQSYLTPASSVLSCQSHSDPHVTGTIQPYLKRADGQLQSRTTLRERHSRFDSTAQSQGSGIQRRASTSSRQRSDGRKITSGIVKQRSVSVPKQTFKMGKTSSAVSLKDGKSTSSFQTAVSSVSWKSHESAAEASASFQSDSSPQCVVRDKSVDMENFQAAHSIQSVDTSAGVGTTIKHHLLPTAPQHFTGLTLTSTPAVNPCQTDLNTPPSSTAALPLSHPPSEVFTTVVQLPPGKQPGAISLVELDRLWKNFIASSFGSQETENKETSTQCCAVHQSTTSHSRREPLREINEEHVFETRDAAIQTTPSLTLSPNPSSTTAKTSHHSQRVLQVHTCTCQWSWAELHIHIFSPQYASHPVSHTSHCKNHWGFYGQTLSAAVNSDRRSWRETESYVLISAEQLNLDIPSTVPRRGITDLSSFSVSSKLSLFACKSYFLSVDVTKNRPKMTPLEMYHNSKRYTYK